MKLITKTAQTLLSISLLTLTLGVHAQDQLPPGAQLDSQSLLQSVAADLERKLDAESLATGKEEALRVDTELTSSEQVEPARTMLLETSAAQKNARDYSAESQVATISR